MIHVYSLWMIPFEENPEENAMVLEEVPAAAAVAVLAAVAEVEVVAEAAVAKGYFLPAWMNLRWL
jgi:hypothetical protein